MLFRPLERRELMGTGLAGEPSGQGEPSETSARTPVPAPAYTERKIRRDPLFHHLTVLPPPPPALVTVGPPPSPGYPSHLGSPLASPPSPRTAGEWNSDPLRAGLYAPHPPPPVSRDGSPLLPAGTPPYLNTKPRLVTQNTGSERPITSVEWSGP